MPNLSWDTALRSIQSEARYLFRAEELAQLAGREPHAVALKSALGRYSKLGRIASLSKHPSTWLIVPPEHQRYGAPPVQWWLDDFLAPIEPHYYLALLSAAHHWGSSHYALQSTQIMVSRPRQSHAVGRLELQFFFKKNLAQTPVVHESKSVAGFRVSTREATLLDLLRHQSKIGGLEAVARITRDLATGISDKGLTAALDAMDQVVSAQRLGFLLEALGLEQLAVTVDSWLGTARRSVRALEPAALPFAQGARMTTSTRWGIEHTPAQMNLLRELA